MPRMTPFSCLATGQMMVGSFYSHANFCTITKSQSTFDRLSGTNYPITTCITHSPIFQRTFNMATGWMIDTGVFQKMERDVTTSTALKGYFQEAFWVPGELRATTPLSMSHMLVVFLIIVIFNSISILIFFGELCHAGRKKNNKEEGDGKKMAVSNLAFSKKLANKNAKELQIQVCIIVGKKELSLQIFLQE